MGNYKIRKRFLASVLFEISVDTDGSNYLIIYGEHINGYFCAITNWGVSCEMGNPRDIHYNTESLYATKLITEETAKEIAMAISEYSLR